MVHSRSCCLLIALVLLGGTLLHAQVPTDSTVWQYRCKLMMDNDQQIQTGTIPPPLLAGTRGIPGQQFTTLAFERFRSGEHNVACTLFYMALIADRAGNGGKPVPYILRWDGIMAHEEAKVVRRQKLTMTERMKRSEIKMHQSKVPALTSAQLQAIIDAADTMPITLAPPPKL